MQIGLTAINQPRIKPVFCWAAQFTELCAACERSGSLPTSASRKLEHELAGRADLAAALYIQIHYNLRVSEVLSIRGVDIDQLGRIFVKPAKGSKPIVITDPLLMQKAKGIAGKEEKLFSELDRFQLYRIYKRLGIAVHSSGKKKAAVTHAFRHINTAAARAAEMSEEMIKEQLHHRSKKSQSYYGTKQQGRK